MLFALTVTYCVSTMYRQKFVFPNDVRRGAPSPLRLLNEPYSTVLGPVR